MLLREFGSITMRLGHWAREQRQRYHNDLLVIERLKKLQDLGFDWKPIGPLMGVRPVSVTIGTYKCIYARAP